jgi:PAS domain S-box-containing protein
MKTKASLKKDRSIRGAKKPARRSPPKRKHSQSKPQGGSLITGLRTVIIDISERRAAEKALERTNWDYQRLLDSISGIVWEADARTLHISFVSRSAERLLGYPLQHWYRHGFWGDHIFYDDREAVLNSLQKAVAESNDVVLEYRMLASNRQPIWVRDTVAVRERSGKLMLFGVAVDITELKQKEKLLRQAHEQLELRVAERTRELRDTVSELEAFSYSLSHDMRAPLRAIQGYSQLLLTTFGEPLGPTGRDYLKRMMASSERLDKLIQDVLRYSKLTRSPVELEEINLQELIGEIINDYPAFQPPNAHVEIQKPLRPVVGNKAFLSQCISNLLSNGVKFHKEGETPRIRISTRRADSHIEVVFEDNGIGIQPQDQNRIFGIFQRVHAGHEFEGTGIGLAIVQRAVERMGGRVGVESAAGQGSKFWLQLPER